MSKKKIEDIYPLSPMQAGMLFHSIHGDEASMFFVQLAVTVEGELDVEAFHRAFQGVVDQHPMLRTGFVWEKVDEPLQVVRGKAKLPFTVEDLSALSGEEQKAALVTRLAEDRARGFDLAKPPLLRVAVYRLGPSQHHIVWSRHHLLLDGWSAPMVLEEVFVRYDAERSGQPARVASRRPFGEYIAWLGAQDPTKSEEFWRKELGRFTTPTPLSVDHAPAFLPDGEPSTGSVWAQVDEATTRALLDLGRKHKLTISTFIQGAWALLLSRYCGEETVVFGGTVSGRSAPIEGIGDMLGMFINTLPVRVDVTESETVYNWLHAHQERQSETRELEWCSLVEVQGFSGVPRGLPLFESAVVVENFPVSEALEQPDAKVRVAAAEVHEETSLPVILSAWVKDRIDLRLLFDRRRFSDGVVARMAQHVAAILRGLAGDSGRLVRDIPMLTEAEQSQLLSTWNPVSTAWPPQKTIHGLFAERVAEGPERVAVSHEGQTLSYAELDARANRLARALRAKGAGPETRVAVCLEPGLDMIVALLAVLKSGGAYVPLDPAAPKDRLAFVVEDAAAPMVVTTTTLAQRVSGPSAQVLCLDADAAQIEAEDASPLGVTSGPENLAYVIYTSGSTGKPKGTLITHHNVVRLFEATQAWYGFGPSDVWTLFHSYAFDFSVWEIWGALVYGGSVLVVPPWVRRSPDDFYALLAEQRVTVLNQTPSAFRQLVNAESARGDVLPLALRYVIFGGEALNLEDLRPWFERHGDQAPTLVNMYGITETTVHVTYRPLRSSDLERSEASVIGRPIPDLQVYVLDALQRPVPVGVVGELYVGGAGVARGYLNRPELTAQRFLQNPFDSRQNAQLYRSGDLARFGEDGDIEYLGRIDHQVKIRGFRIELGEIEVALRQHPSLVEVVVLAREDVRGDQRLTAYFVLREGSKAPTRDELRAFLGTSLPDYMVPSVFVTLAAIPLTSNGKVDRGALPSPDEGALAPRTFVAPRTPIEEAVAAIWSELLRVPRVGAEDGFFDLGGHSLVATQVIARMRRTFGVDIDIRALFEAPTVIGLARRVEEALRSGDTAAAPPLLRAQRSEEIPLSFAQERLWFLDQLEPGSAVYNIPAALRLRGSLHVEALTRAVSELVSRHEALRTTFTALRGRPVQVIHEPADVPLPLDDVSAVPEDEREQTALELVAHEASLPFDLAKGPLVRARLLRLAPEEHVFVLVCHHVVADNWTLGVVVREIATLYQAFSENHPSPLPELPLQYADYAIWQRGWLSGEVLAAELGYWQRALTGAPDVLDLPTDRPRPAVQSFRGSSIGFKLSAEVSRGLNELSRREGVTLFMTLVAGFSLLLARLSRQDDVVLGSPIANRTHAETEALVGFFVNTLVLRTGLDENEAFRALLAKVRATCLGAYAHQQVPFERIVEELKVRRDMSRSPLFQVAFALQNAPVEALPLGGLTLEALAVESTTTKFDLTLVMAEEADGLSGLFEYATDLFDKSTVSRWASQLVVLFEAVVADASRPLHAYPLLTAAERQHVLVELNRTRTSYPRNATIHGLFEEQVDRAPGALALLMGERTMTYGELEARSNHLAAMLMERGVGPETRVGLAAERSFEMVVATLAILKAGGCYVPLDTDYPAERFRFMVNDAGATLLLATEAQAARLPETSAEVIVLSSNDVSSEAPRPDVEVGPLHLAYMMYTSGSTGTPKGVLVMHRNVVRLVKNTNYVDLGENEVFLQFAPISFDASTLELWAPLLNGGRVALAPAGKVSFAELGEVIRRHGVTSAWLTGGLFNAMIEASPESLAPLKQLLVGGEALSVPHMRRAMEQLPGTRLINGYGPTEGTTFSCCFTIEDTDRSSIPIGPPIANSTAYVLDAHQEPVGIGVPGELFIGGDGVARGYHERPELSAARFVNDPFGDKKGTLYRTGDLVRWLPSGVLEYLGRLDTQVKIRGYRIELGEVETVLGRLPQIREATCLAREDAPGEKRLVAYVVPAEGVTIDAAELRHSLAEHLPAFMIPALFIALDALPLTPNGKVDKRALPAPDFAQGADEEPPSGETEERLAAIWMELLSLPSVGRNDDFFDRGGHSLLAARLVGEIEARMGVIVPLAALFHARTLRELARAVDTMQAKPGQDPLADGRWPALVPIQTHGSRFPFFAVSRPNINALGYVALARHMHPDQPVYGLQGQFREQEEIGPYTDDEYQTVAADYIREMRRVQPHGPYYLGGMCEGAHLAYAITQQLEAAGEEVGLVAILDAWPWENTHIKSLLSVHNMDMRVWRLRVLYQAGHGAEITARLKAGALRKLKSVAAKTAASANQGFIRREKPPAKQTLFEARMFPGPDFVAPKIKARIGVFRVKKQPYWRVHDFQLGWTDRTEGGVEVHVIAGEHMTFLREPFAAVLGAKLTEVLERLRVAREERLAGAPKAAE